jgi:flagellar protein FlaJ
MVSMMNRLFRSLGRVYSRGYRKSIGRLLDFSGSLEPPEVWLGKICLTNLLFLAAFSPLWIRFNPFSDSLLILLILDVIGSAAIQAFGYTSPYYAGGRRAKAVEVALPNFYQLMSSYMRSGMTPFQALKSSSKKEFGILKTEVDIATSKALGTQSFSDSLMNMTKRIRSDSLKRSTELMIRGMDSGGSLASMLEESASNILESKAMKREIISSSRTYTLMIIFAVLIGSPLLLSISTRFNDRLLDMTSQISEGAGELTGLETSVLAGGSAIDPGRLMIIASATIVITSFISSLLVGIISDGNEKYGLRYAVIFVPLSLALFWGFAMMLKAVF